MKKHNIALILLLTALFFVACSSGSSSSTGSTSSVAQLAAFTFQANDSMPGLAAAEFTIEERIDTGLVYNKDSMLYGTSLEKVVPKFVFKVAVGSAKLQTTDTTIMLTGKDTVDFTKQPIYLTLKSSDGTTTKVYEIHATVHQADPELFQWQQLNSGIYPIDDSEQKVVELNGQFVMISNNGFQNTVYSSRDAQNWSTLGSSVGLPASCRVRQIISDNSTLYYADGKTLYTSVDALSWTARTMVYKMQTMVLYWNEKVWVLIDNNGPELATVDASTATIEPSGLRPDGDFPVSDFAAVCFQSASQRERAMIIGGFAENGKSLNTRWNLEYSEYITANNGYRLSEFSIDRPEFESLTGVAVVYYNGKLMMFGGVDKDMTYLGRDILISSDEGLSWVQADTTKNQLPEIYQARQKQNAIVHGNYIYLFGGKDASKTYSDVYRGILNSVGWK